jgi:hypothetical protein
MTAGYSGKPLSAKLGLASGQRLLVVEAPAHLDALIADAPPGIARLARLREFDVGWIFVTRAAELAPHGITCNAIAPGYFETELSARLRADAAMVERITARIPIGRWGVPQDLAGLAVFLASAASSYITGQQIVVDGGKGSVL